MKENLQRLTPLLPALWLTGAAVVALLTDAFSKKLHRSTLGMIAGVGILGAAIAAVRMWEWEGGPTVLGGMVATDRLAVAGTLGVLVAAFAGVLFSYDYFEGRERGELYPLLLFAATGMVGLVSSANLLMVFLSLEVLSLSLYVLVGFTLRQGAGEASLKYFLLGAFSSAFFLYGVAMTYGAAGTTSITGIANALTARPVPAIALVGIALLGVGFSFKIAIVPFHMWAPDAYQGAPAPVTAFMAAGTKIAAVVALLRVLDVAFQPLTWNWTGIIMFLAVVSMFGGAIVSMVQTDVKRLLAYSSVSHAGFIFVGVSAGALGISAALFYLAAYGLTVLGAFGVVSIAGRGQAEATDASSFRGLAKRSPFLAGLMSIFLLSLAGIPPTVGFMAKLSVFSATIQAGAVWLAILAVIASVVAAYAYLRVLAWMYFDDPATDQPAPGRTQVSTAVGIIVPAVLVLVLGIIPGLITPLLEQASVLTW